MMIFKITLCIVIFVLFIVIFMSIVENKIRDRQNEKIIWRMEEMDKKRDRVVTRTGGLENDRLNERQ